MRDKRTPKDVCGEASSQGDSVKSVSALSLCCHHFFLKSKLTYFKQTIKHIKMGGGGGIAT